MKLNAIDVETEPTEPTDQPWALEPWRVKQSKARISCYTIVSQHGNGITYTEDIESNLFQDLEDLEGEYVIAHNALFDAAWSYATIENYDVIRGIKWLDSALLSKWLTNTNDRVKEVSHSLINVCNRYIPDHPDMDEFNDVKSQKITAGEDFDYWIRRNKLDTRLTLEVFKAMWKLLPEKSRNGYLIEQACIAPLAKGWVKGIPYDIDHANKLAPKIAEHKAKLCRSIGVDISVLTSPKKKRELLFDNWGVTPIKYTDKGSPSTDHETLMRLHQKHQNPKFDKLMAAIKMATMESKYINGFRRSLEYVSEPILYGSPKIFGTYTGRMTYKSKTTKKQEHQCSIALHQMSRKAKAINHTMKAPEGKGIIKIDANSQEVRFMAIQSGDKVMIDAYNNNMDLHSVMTASITGRAYDDIVHGNKTGDLDIVEDRQAGKLLNLSCSYRIGASALAKKFFTTYEKSISFDTSQRYLEMYKTTYPGVPTYWKHAIAMARANGGAETVAHRKCNIYKFDWHGESSAINHPIQGSGGEHKYATIKMIDEHHPELDLVLDMHDGLFYFCDLEVIEETTRHIMELTRHGAYNEIWNVDLPIELPFDGQFSRTSFAEFGDEL